MNGSRPRVLVVTVRADHGGGPEHLWRLMQAAGERVEFFVACPDEAPYHARYRELVGADAMIGLPHRRFAPAALVALCRFVKRKQIEIIHSHGKGGGLYGRLAARWSRVPAVHTFHGIHVGDYGPAAKRLYLALERWLSSCTKRLIAVSAGERDEALALNIAPAAKVVTIENGVVVPPSPPQRAPLDGRALQVLTMTRYNRQKNPELLFSIIAAMQSRYPDTDIRFVVLGTGEGHADFVTALRQRGLQKQVDVVGAVDDPARWLGSADCYLSTSRWEGLPLALIEAMAAGLPVVATRVTGNADVVEHERTGLLYPAQDADGAADLIATLVPDSRRTGLGRAAWVEAAARFSVDRMAMQTTDLYALIAGGDALQEERAS